MINLDNVVWEFNGRREMIRYGVVEELYIEECYVLHFCRKVAMAQK